MVHLHTLLQVTNTPKDVVTIQELLNAPSIWTAVLVWIVYLVVNITMKYFERRLQQQTEIERKNAEIKKYNDDAIWKENMLAAVSGTAINRLSFPKAQTLSTVHMQNAERDLIIYLYDILDKNHIDEEDRKKSIHTNLTVYLSLQQDKVYGALESLKYNNSDLSDYVLTTDEQHSADFIQAIETILFKDTVNLKDIKKEVEKVLHIFLDDDTQINFVWNVIEKILSDMNYQLILKKDDLKNVIYEHYGNHTKELISYIKSAHKKN